MSKNCKLLVTHVGQWIDSSMTQWKRAGLITLRSLDRNQLLLRICFCFVLKKSILTPFGMFGCQMRCCGLFEFEAADIQTTT